MNTGTIISVNFWKAAGIRALKTFLQTILGVWTAGQIITAIDWKATLIAAVSAGIYSLLTSIVAGLPEVQLADTLYDLDNDGEETPNADYKGDEND